MKKFFTLAVITATVATVSASSLKWGFGSGSLFVAKEGETVGVAAAAYTGTIPDGAYLALVYLGDSTTLDVASVKSSDVVDTIAYGFEGDTEESFWAPATKTFAVTANAGYSVGDSFGVVFFNGKTFAPIFDISDWDSGTIGEALNPVVTVTDLAANKSFSVNPSAVSSDGAAAVVVPEPGTAALALLGVGMLLKRRKA